MLFFFFKKEKSICFPRNIRTRGQNPGGLWINCGLLERCLKYSAIILMVVKSVWGSEWFSRVLWPHTDTQTRIHAQWAALFDFAVFWWPTGNCASLRCAALKSDNANDSLPGIIPLRLLAGFWSGATVLNYFCLTTSSWTFLKHAVRASQHFFFPPAAVSVRPLGLLPRICTNLSPMKQHSSRLRPPTKVHRVLWLNTCC